MTTTTLVSVVVMVMVLVTAAHRLGLRPRDIEADDDVIRPELRASMQRHPSARPVVPAEAPWPARPVTAPPAGPPMAAAPTPHLHAAARVVFAGVQDGRLVLDCVIAGSEPGSAEAPPGLPITLSLGALDTPWMAVHIEAMLERWADGERVVDLELLDSPLGPRATLVSASSRVVLPLATVAGLG